MKNILWRLWIHRTNTLGLLNSPSNASDHHSLLMLRNERFLALMLPEWGSSALRRLYGANEHDFQNCVTYLPKGRPTEAGSYRTGSVDGLEFRDLMRTTASTAPPSRGSSDQRRLSGVWFTWARSVRAVRFFDDSSRSYCIAFVNLVFIPF